MTRNPVPLLVIGIFATGVVAAVVPIGPAAAQQPPAAAPEPKMPPMPSMEGQQGDVSKPITQIPPHKKPAPEKAAPAAKSPPKGATKAAPKGAPKARPSTPRKRR